MQTLLSLLHFAVADFRLSSVQWLINQSTHVAYAVGMASCWCKIANFHSGVI